MTSNAGQSTFLLNTADPFSNVGTLWNCLLGSIGRQTFESAMTKLLVNALGVDQIHIFRGAADEPEMISSICANGSGRAKQQSDLYFSRRIWRFDSEFSQHDHEIRNEPAVFRFEMNRTANREMIEFYKFVDIGERVVAIGNSSVGRLYLAVIWSRNRERFTADEEQRLRILVDIAFSMINRHYELIFEKHRFHKILDSLHFIENTLSLSKEKISKRERQVISRILYGQSSDAIGLDLQISSDTVVCYRRRFYQRFGIGCFRDLVIWYMELAVLIENETPENDDRCYWHRASPEIL